MTRNLDLIEAGQLYLFAPDGSSSVRLYQIGNDLIPVEVGLARWPRHGRGSLGHGYTEACDSAGEQCNNVMCRNELSHSRCTPACSGETFWNDLGPWQISAVLRDLFLTALNANASGGRSA